MGKREYHGIVYDQIDLKDAVNQEVAEFSASSRARVLAECIEQKNRMEPAEHVGIVDKKEHGGVADGQNQAENKWRLRAFPRKWGLVAAVLLILSIGTVFAANYSPLSRFFSDESLIKPGEQSNYTYLQDSHNDITLVIDAMIPKEKGYILVASLINEGEEPWDEQIVEKHSQIWGQLVEQEEGASVNLGEEGEEINLMAGGITIMSSPVLSDDGRRLTVVQEGFKEDVVGHEFEVNVENFIVPKKPEEIDVYLPLDEIYKENGTYLAQPRFEGDYYDSFHEMYEGLDENYEFPVSDSFPDLLCAGAGIAVWLDEDGQILDYNTDGLHLYTRMTGDFTKQETWLTSEGVRSKIESPLQAGLITEITNINTGEVIKMSQDRLNFGVVSASMFEGITDVSQLSEYAATKVTYYEEDIIPGRWTVSFVVEESIAHKAVSYSGRIPVGYGPEEGPEKHGPAGLGQQDGYAEFDGTLFLSPLGVIVRGEIIDAVEDLSSIEDMYMSGRHYLDMKAVLKDGTVKPLHSVYLGEDESLEFGFVQQYNYDSPEGEVRYALVDVDDIDCLIINGEKVAVEK